jgi:replicative DNA helicase
MKEQPMAQLDNDTVSYILQEGQKKDNLLKKKDFVNQKKVERDYEKEVFLESEHASVSTLTQEYCDDMFSSLQSQLYSNYKRDYSQRNKSFRDAVPFISEAFDSKFKLVPGQLVTVAAYTGTGKTTTVVNVAYKYLMQGKRVFIISNEESSNDVYDKVSCLMEGVDPLEYANQHSTPEQTLRIMKRFQSLVQEKRLFVLDCELSNNGTTKSEYVLNLIKKLDKATVKPDVVLIDYLTNIYTAGSSSSDNHYFQLEKFLSELKNILNTLSFPIIMCAQMHSDDKKKGAKSMDTRMVMGGSILRYSTIVIEVKVNFDTKITTYEIHKNRRFQHKGSVELIYDKGIMRPIAEGEVIMPQSIMKVLTPK